jgi:hypothetical protein
MKKTSKENPVTFFRKADEARQKVVKRSLKKAQNGIQVNATSTNPALDYDKQMLAKQQAENMKMRSKEIEAKRKLEDQTKMTNKFKTDALNEMYPNYQIGQNKKGGSVKRKK